MELKMALARLPCYKSIVPILLQSPLSELQTRCPLTPGVPVKAMLAHPTKVLTLLTLPTLLRPLLVQKYKHGHLGRYTQGGADVRAHQSSFDFCLLC